jgi:hypothetical protein
MLFFRDIHCMVLNPAPFDPGISNIWSYNILLPYVVPGPCPVEVPILVLPRLTLAQAVTAPYGNMTNNLAAGIDLGSYPVIIYC